MKNISLILTAVLLAFIGAASAQQYQPVALYTQGTNAIAGSATVSPAAVFTLTKFNNVALQLTAKASGSTDTNAVTASFAKSVDGVTYETTPSVTLAVTSSSTNAITGVTNAALGAVGYLKLTSIVNSNTNALTGVSVQAVKKPNN